MDNSLNSAQGVSTGSLGLRKDYKQVNISEATSGGYIIHVSMNYNSESHVATDAAKVAEIVTTFLNK
jgi:hypothetical protein